MAKLNADLLDDLTIKVAKPTAKPYMLNVIHRSGEIFIHYFPFATTQVI